MVRKIGLFCFTMALSASAAAGNIVFNGNFITGDLTDWNTDPSVFFGVAPFPSPPDPGMAPMDTTFAASSRCAGAPCNDPVLGSWISQTLATSPSETYTLTFLYDAGSSVTLSGSETTELDVLWNGSIVPSGQIIDATFNEWQEYTFTGLTAAGASTVLEFTGRQDPETLYLTDISVTATGSSSTTPEPASLLLMGGGLLAVGMLRFWRQA